MRCSDLRTMKHPTTQMWLQYGCGQCLSCRIKKQQNWVLRNRLELTSASSAQFWTLTLDKQGLHSLANLGPRKIIKNFFDALRASERRHGNSMMIRYFGCHEFGGTFGRPHFHFLIYNLRRNLIDNSPYRPGLPRPQIHMPLWPHGHIDLGTVNPASMRYVASYMTEFQDKALGNILFSTRRPAIGYYGLVRLVDSLARNHSCLPEITSLKIGETQYPLDMWTRKTLRELYREKGIKTLRAEPFERKLQALSFDIAFAQTSDPIKVRQKYEEKVARHEHQKTKKAAREGKAVAAAAAIAARASAASEKTDPDLSAPDGFSHCGAVETSPQSSSCIG